MDFSELVKFSPGPNFVYYYVFSDLEILYSTFPIYEFFSNANFVYYFSELENFFLYQILYICDQCRKRGANIENVIFGNEEKGLTLKMYFLVILEERGLTLKM